ncbi:MAG: prepilin-type N-terminal cleavage/methylation domain-containing protein [Gammaproteobacteria bacterium]|nr:prepilin-type N-terminal cleavage/methylation domain-containing protein [Gammaproteobacteria bacterium]
MHKSPRRDGFSVIELLVAMTLLALVLGSLYQVFGQGLRLVDRSGDYAVAALYAESKLSEIGVEEALEVGSSNGDFDEKYRWQLDLTPFEFEPDTQPTGESSAELLQVRLEVFWGKGRGAKSVSFSTLRVQQTDL